MCSLTVLDCNNVAAQVHAETIPEAMRPGLTDRDAVLNSSDCFVEYAVYRFWIHEMPIMRKAKKNPIPTTTPEHLSALYMRQRGINYHNRRQRVGQPPQSLPLYVYEVEYGVIDHERRSESPYSIVAVH